PWAGGERLSGTEDEKGPQGEQPTCKNLEEVAARLHIESEEKRNERAAGESQLATSESNTLDEPAGHPEIAERHREQTPPSELKQDLDGLRRCGAGLVGAWHRSAGGKSGQVLGDGFVGP